MQHKATFKQEKWKAKQEKQRQEKDKKMCKLLIMPGIKPNKAEAAWKFLTEAQPHLNEFDKDGFGYAAITKRGELFGERWVDPADAFKNRYEPTPEEQHYLKDYMGALTQNVEYNHFGDIGQFYDATSVMLHARAATCAKNIQNTHPFVRDGMALIHNGVIRNTRDLEQRSSTCDSECILNEYVNEGVKDDAYAVQSVAHKLEGYYACGVMGVQDDGTPYLDIFRDNQAPLYVVYIKELENIVFCTSARIVLEAAKSAKMTVGFMMNVQGGVIMRVNAVTGVTMDVVDFDPQYLSQYMRNQYAEDQKSKSTSLEVIRPATQAQVEEFSKGTITVGDDSPITEEDIDTLVGVKDPFYHSQEGFRKKA